MIVPAIKYTTEGRVQIDCQHGHTKPVALVWLKGNTHVKLLSGGSTVELSPSQLEQLYDIIPRMIEDLEP